VTLQGHTFSRVDFAVDDRDETQRELNALYGYEHDVTTKVMHRNRLNLFVLLVRRLAERRVLTRFETALDVGCSAGVYAVVLRELGFRSVLGIDADEAAIRVARERFCDKARFEVQRAEDLDPNGRFDFVLCTEVLEHTDDADAVARNVARAVAPGGIAVVSAPNALSWPFAAMRLAERLRGRPLDAELRRHLEYPSFRTRRLLEAAGLRRVATDGTNLLFDPKLLGALYGTTAFPLLNQVNSALARAWPLRYASQFFFVAFKRDD
jgi:2-polyprenyl-3-methyl-5-hydroxy-6-metoxy-1,4-benzoquinol methylase